MSSDTTKSTLILPSIPLTPVYKSYPQRFYVLAVFSYLSFNNCIIWLTFSPIARNVEAYYSISEATIDLLLNWGPIIYIPCLPLTYLLMNKHHGLRRCVILLAITNFFAAFVRVLPIVITSPSSPHFSSISLPFLHFGQILNAACSPLVTVPVSQLSSLWFLPHERTRATTIAVISHTLGGSISFAVSPYIVSAPDQVPRLLYLHLGLAFVACVLTLLYFPAQPPSAPSAAAELLMLHSTGEQSNNSVKKFMKDVGKCLTTPSFVLVAIPAGLVTGTFGPWTSLFDLILEPEHYTEQQAGWFSFGASIAGIIGGLLISIVADARRFQHSLKLLIVTAYIGCLLAIIWFQLSVHTYFYDKPILPSTAITIGLSTALAGLFVESAFPLVFEATAEILYPLPESLSASIFSQWLNIVSLVFLFIAPNRSKLMNFLVLVVVAFCILMIVFARFTYRRRDEDERKRLEKEEQTEARDAQLSGINNEQQQQYGTLPLNM